MKLNNCSVRFYLDQTRARHDGFPIFCRIIIYRKKSEFKIGFYCHSQDWDEVLGIPKSRSQDALIKQGEIARIQSVINNALNDANRAGKQITAAEVKALMTSSVVKRYTLLSL